ncbi:MAG: hypothetical protein J2P16_08735 [Mycobacterium sp.]|nr:hypothetical protein [Mycobacterium sp.]
MGERPHVTHSVRRVSGWGRWRAECSCGWTSRWCGKDDADRYVQLHAEADPAEQDRQARP